MTFVRGDLIKLVFLKATGYIVNERNITLISIRHRIFHLSWTPHLQKEVDASSPAIQPMYKRLHLGPFCAVLANGGCGGG